MQGTSKDFDRDNCWDVIKCPLGGFIFFLGENFENNKNEK
jgi:hypothetical protein